VTFSNANITISDYEYQESKKALDQVFQQANKLHQVFHSYNDAITNLTQFNQIFGTSTTKIFPEGHASNSDAIRIQKAHQESGVAYAEF